MRRVALALGLILVLLVGLVGPVSAASQPSKAAQPAVKPITVIIDGKTLTFEVPPYQEKGTTLVPMRAIFEALGATVQWDEKTQTVTAVRGDTTIVLTLGKKEARVRGKAVTLVIPAVKSKGKTMVPLRFVSEALGAEVNWNPATRTITIISGKAVISSGTPGAVDQEALKLLQKTYSTEPQDMDFSGKITLKADMSGLPMINVDATMSGSARKNYDMYLTFRMKMLAMGTPPQDMEFAMAVKDKVLYSKDLTTGQWLNLGVYDPKDPKTTGLDLKELGLSEFNPTEFSKWLTEGGLFKEVKIVGEETVDGKTYKKVLAVFSPDFFKEMMKKLTASQTPGGNAAPAELNVTFEKFEMTVLIDPVTGLARRTDAQVSMSMPYVDAATGTKLPIGIKFSVVVDQVQNRAPIQFPDLSGAVKSEGSPFTLPLPGTGK